jgi:hypothetical protein
MKSKTPEIKREQYQKKIGNRDVKSMKSSTLFRGCNEKSEKKEPCDHTTAWL